jgi:hypothetical protein
VSCALPTVATTGLALERQAAGTPGSGRRCPSTQVTRDCPLKGWDCSLEVTAAAAPTTFSVFPLLTCELNLPCNSFPKRDPKTLAPPRHYFATQMPRLYSDWLTSPADKEHPWATMESHPGLSLSRMPETPVPKPPMAILSQDSAGP